MSDGGSLGQADAGEVRLRESDLSVERVVDGALRIVQDRDSRSGVTLEVNVADGLPRLRADERAIKQILINLLFAQLATLLCPLQVWEMFCLELLQH